MKMLVMAMLAAVTIADAARADDVPKYAPVPDWVKAAPPLDAASVDAQTQFLIFDQQQRIEDGRLWAYLDTAVPISTPAALAQSGTIQLPWMPDHGDLIVHRAQIVRKGETIDLLADGTRFQVLQRELGMEQRMLTGMLTATLEPGGLRLGDVLRVTFSMTAKDPALKGDVQTVLPLLAEPLRADFARARLMWPKALALKVRDYVEGVDPAVNTSGDWNEIEVALPIAKLPELPADAPVRYQHLPLLEAASFADWPSVSRTMAPLYATEGLIGTSGPLAAEVERIRKLGKTPRERAALALQTVQGEVRYLFRGMEGGNYTPQTPAKTWELRYGDCKAKTLLLLALLRAMDIDAEAVLVNSILGDRLPTRLPSAGAFDHVIVRAMIDGAALWLDGTAAGARIEDIADTPPFRHALPLRAAGSELMPIELRPPARPDFEVVLKLDQRAGVEFPAPFEIEVAFRGQLASQLQEFARQANEDQIEGFANSTIDDFVAVTTVHDEQVRYDAATGRAILSASGITYPRWQRIGAENRLALDYLIPAISFTPDRSRPAWRAIPVATGNPAMVAVTTITQLPEGFRLGGAAQHQTRIGDLVVVRNASVKNNILTMVERQTSGGAELAVAELPHVRKQAAQAKSALLYGIVPQDEPRWQKVDAASKNAAFAPILQGFEKAIEDTPDSSAPLYNRSLFKSDIYDRQGAIEDLTKAIAIQEQAVYLTSRAGLYRQQSNDEAALADLIAAQALAPDDFAILSSLATLYSEQGEHDEALALIGDRATPETDLGRSYLALKASLLARSGASADAIAAVDDAITASPRSADLLNQRCWLRGTLNIELDAALADCTRAIEIGESPAAALDSRALLHFRQNRLEEAQKDLDAALDLAPEQSASLYLRGVVRKARGDTVGAERDRMAARMMSPRVEEDYARWGIKY